MDEVAVGCSRILNIHDGHLDLGQDIVRGLCSQPRNLPSLLLWDTVGLKLFDRLAGSCGYYPARKETSLLCKNVEDICERIRGEGVILELGSGNINKTAIFLQALVSHSKPFIYFALDVSYGELERNLARLAYKIPQHRGSINGLCGTYDDLIRALDGPLARLRSCEMTYLWFGNSFTNAQPESSVAFLSKLLAGSCSHPTQKSPRLQALVAIDGCRDAKRVLEAYGTHTTVHRDFLFHGLDHANKVLGQDVFVEDHWGVSTQFDESSGLLLQKFVAKGSMELSIDGRRLQIGRGEEINICQSGKWEQSEVKLMANAGGLKIVGEWHHEDGDYGESSHTRFEVHGMSRLLARKRQGMRTDRA